MGDLPSQEIPVSGSAGCTGLGFEDVLSEEVLSLEGFELGELEELDSFLEFSSFEGFEEVFEGFEPEGFGENLLSSFEEAGSEPSSLSVTVLSAELLSLTTSLLFSVLVEVGGSTGVCWQEVKMRQIIKHSVIKKQFLIDFFFNTR